MEHNITILSTRELDEAQAIRLREKGFRFDQVPFIEMKPRTGEGLRNELKALTGKPLLAVFTSRVGVAAVTGLLDSVPGQWQVACMGGATRTNAESFFGSETVVLESGSAKELGEKLQAMDSPLPVVFFAGNRRLDELPALLQSHPAGFSEVTVYDTNETPVKLQQPYDGILFFSPSAAQSFFSVNEAAADTVLFAIGDTTAAAIRQLSANKIITSPFHSPAKMIEAVLGHFAGGQLD
ncbi:MAG: uroporphyrinogen-III synthase [Chitinophagaceae bacterium]|nr:MAG: uroporphyrinogen-III synthase [Chitinophagaceae bacterium]